MHFLIDFIWIGVGYTNQILINDIYLVYQAQETVSNIERCSMRKFNRLGSLVLCAGIVLSLCACSGKDGMEESKVDDTVGIIENVTESSEETFDGEISSFNVNWEDVRVEIFECMTYLSKSKQEQRTKVLVLFTYTGDYENEDGRYSNVFDVIDDYYKFGIEGTEENVLTRSKMSYGTHINVYPMEEGGVKNQVVADYDITGELKIEDLCIQVFDKATNEEVYKWDGLSVVDKFEEDCPLLLKTNEGYWYLNDFNFGSGSSSSDDRDTQYEMLDTYKLSIHEDGSEMFYNKLDGEFRLLTRDGQDFAEVCGLEAYQEISSSEAIFGVYYTGDFDFRNKAYELGLVLEYKDGENDKLITIYK